MREILNPNLVALYWATANSRGILVTFFASFPSFLGRFLSIILRGDAAPESQINELDWPQTTREALEGALS